MARRRLRERGFTLVELAIVVAIIGILAVLAVMGYRTVINSSRTAEPRQFVMAIRLAEESYKSETGAYASISPTITAADRCPTGAGITGAGMKKWGWNPACGTGANGPWSTINAIPDGSVMFGYAVVASSQGAAPVVMVAGNQAFPPTAFALPQQWYVVYAEGDTDDNAQVSKVSGNSLTKDLSVEEE
jgi:type IV pilus assembly protein PilA